MRKTIKTPEAAGEWKERLRSFSMRIGFHLSLSKSMLEMLCAVADDVTWDRGIYHHGRSMPENWLASQASLVKRGLIERKSEEERDEVTNRRYKKASDAHIQNLEFYEFSYYKLTPAGDCVVNLLRLAGLFVESDAAITKKSRRA